MVTEQAVLALVNAYEGSSSLKQDEILQALGLIGGYEATEFLTKIMQSGPASRALQAAMALKQTGTEGINRLYELSEKTSSLAALTKHVLDERI